MEIVIVEVIKALQLVLMVVAISGSIIILTCICDKFNGVRDEDY